MQQWVAAYRPRRCGKNEPEALGLVKPAQIR